MARRKTINAVRMDESFSLPAVSSPLRRRSLAASEFSNAPKPFTQNDDESERLARRAVPVSMDSSSQIDNSEIRASIGLGSGIGELSTNALMDHYNKCIKLCAENKITTKNAFALSVIDYMTVLNKRDINSNNMQSAGTTLDVSTKIYGVRVDCVHTDVFKMAGDPGKQNKGEEQNQGVNDANASTVQEPESKRKKKPLSQKILCSLESLEGTPETINLCSTTNTSDSQTTDMLFQVTFPIHATSGHRLHLQEDVILEFAAKKKAGADTVYTGINVSDIEDLADSNMCPILADFHILGWSETDIPDSPPPAFGQEDNNLRFDLNASVGDLCDNENVGMNYFDLDEASQENIDRCTRKPEHVEHIVDFSQAVSTTNTNKSNTLEYSYLQKSVHNLHWAGPIHWKPKIFSGRVVGACGQEAVRKKKEVNLKFTVKGSEDNVEKLEGKISHRLQTKTMRQTWQDDKLTLPEDIHYESTNPTKFYYHSSMTKQLLPLDKPNGEAAGEEGNLDATVLDDDVDYDYDNQNDTQNYCSQNDDGGRGDANCNSSPDMFHDEDGDPHPDGELCTQALTGENLVIAPKSTTQVQINYSTRAKKINMRQLKNSIWKTLSHKNTLYENGNGDTNEEASKLKDERSFGSVYKILPNTLGKDNAAALSPALAFVSLLHLANEKTLCITTTPDMSDLKISQG
ncbi:condensin complex subunit 2 [Neodiprion lecontei]|uniref:Condensin complex subunit 2 n=1 Tax=Neodiprion lecontei TaxID=441921 RepID=A0A6J0BZ46_NEOLC|nr:condensin complex subunit 2 [Neodiprion lecontei]XP_046589919.1 condensin complex subunit 2 [Neodiprion lecontei]XP_046589920.1 condensin complex subunit 2 [Neodiprion lecontei]